MKKTTLLILIGMIALTGCAHHYVIRLSNGTEITTATKLQLREGVYQFKDAKGEEHFVPLTRVREVAPASMAQKEDRPQPLKVESPPKKRKWYLLWLW